MTHKRPSRRQSVQFNIKKTSVKVSFSFLALVLLSLVDDKFNFFILTIICAFLHESIHVITILFFGGNVKSASLSLFGGNIVTDGKAGLSDLQEAIVSLSAPLFNIFLGFIFLCVFKINEEFALMNLLLGCFNLMPFYTFDGGRVIKYTLSHFVNETFSENIVTISSVVVTFCFSVFSAIVYFNYSKNYTLVVFTVYMICSLLFKKKISS